MADENETAGTEEAKPRKMTNTTKATAAGATVGAGGSAVIAWLAAEGEKRYGIPVMAGAAILGTVFAFVARWAAKLLPDE